MIVYTSYAAAAPAIKKKRGRGFGRVVNSAINKLPVELHIPGYNYCGPGTKLQKRLARGDTGVNLLDEACKEHDIAYNTFPDDLDKRRVADQELASAAVQRMYAKDASLGERLAATGVAGIMKTKTKLGMGAKKKKGGRKKGGSVISTLLAALASPSVRKTVGMGAKKKKTVRKKQGGSMTPLLAALAIPSVRKKLGLGITFNAAVRAAKTAINNSGARTLHEGARAALKALENKRITRVPRVVPVPKRGGILPLLPIFAALGAAGSLAGGAAGIAKAVNDAKSNRRRLEEEMRHNNTMEAIALRGGKQGTGLYLGPYKRGYGLYLRPYQPYRRQQKNY